MFTSPPPHFVVLLAMSLYLLLRIGCCLLDAPFLLQRCERTHKSNRLSGRARIEVNRPFRVQYSSQRSLTKLSRAGRVPDGLASASSVSDVVLLPRTSSVSFFRQGPRPRGKRWARSSVRRAMAFRISDRLSSFKRL
jgi:hypothetical protein